MDWVILIHDDKATIINLSEQSIQVLNVWKESFCLIYCNFYVHSKI